MKIVIIGTGNVATQLGLAFVKAKHSIIQVYGRNRVHSKTLAGQLNSISISNLNKINLEADVYLLAVSDSACQSILKNLNLTSQIIVHTSGSNSITIFKNKFKNYGVLYPVQTISKQISVDISKTPICIEANNKTSELKLMQLAKSISNRVYYLNSEQRSKLHLAAVFVNNFSNHLFTIGETILKENKLSLDLLKPLIQQTVENIKTNSAVKSQTGPALRGDKTTITKHLKQLKAHPAYQKIYKDISASIQQTKK